MRKIKIWWKKQSLSKKLFWYFLLCFILIWLFSSINNYVYSQNYAAAKGFDNVCGDLYTVPRECSFFKSIFVSFIDTPLITIVSILFTSFTEPSAVNILFLLLFWTGLIAIISSIAVCNRVKNLFKRKK